MSLYYAIKYGYGQTTGQPVQIAPATADPCGEVHVCPDGSFIPLVGGQMWPEPAVLLTNRPVRLTFQGGLIDCDVTVPVG